MTSPSGTVRSALQLTILLNGNRFHHTLCWRLHQCPCRAARGSDFLRGARTESRAHGRNSRPAFATHPLSVPRPEKTDPADPHTDTTDPLQTADNTGSGLFECRRRTTPRRLHPEALVRHRSTACITTVLAFGDSHAYRHSPQLDCTFGGLLLLEMNSSVLWAPAGL